MFKRKNYSITESLTIPISSLPIDTLDIIFLINVLRGNPPLLFFLVFLLVFLVKPSYI